MRSIASMSEWRYRTRTPVLLEVVGQVLRHPLGQGGHQDPLPPFLAEPDLVEQVIHLPFHRANLYLGVHQEGGPDDLLHHGALGKTQLEVSRRRRYRHHAAEPGA